MFSKHLLKYLVYMPIVKIKKKKKLKKLASCYNSSFLFIRNLEIGFYWGSNINYSKLRSILDDFVFLSAPLMVGLNG